MEEDNLGEACGTNGWGKNSIRDLTEETWKKQKGWEFYKRGL
jgi:hypothetical protein